MPWDSCAKGSSGRVIGHAPRSDSARLLFSCQAGAETRLGGRTAAVRSTVFRSVSVPIHALNRHLK